MVVGEYFSERAMSDWAKAMAHHTLPRPVLFLLALARVTRPSLFPLPRQLVSNHTLGSMPKVRSQLAYTVVGDGLESNPCSGAGHAIVCMPIYFWGIHSSR